MARLAVEQLEGRDVPAVTFTVEALSHTTEGGTPGTFRVTATGDPSDFTPYPVVAIWWSTGGTATHSSDYTASPTPNSYLYFASSGSQATITITPVDDSDVEGTETVGAWVQRYYMAPVGPAATATLSLHDNDTPPPPVVSVVRVADAFEGDTPGLFQFTRSGDTSQALDIVYDVDSMIDDAAEAGADYTPLSGTLSFPPGMDAVTVEVQAGYDYIHENEEYVKVRVAVGLGYVPALGFAVVAVQDKNSPPVFGKKGYEFSVYGLPEEEVTVGTIVATDPDQDPVQYFLPVGGDPYFAVEVDKGVVTLPHPNQVPLGTGKHQFQVEAHDGRGGVTTVSVTVYFRPIVLFTGDFYAAEGNSDTITITIVRIGKDISQSLDVSYAPDFTPPQAGVGVIASDLADDGAVFQLGSVTIPAGSESAALVVVAKQDNLIEPSETFGFKLTPSVTGTYQVYVPPPDSVWESEVLDGQFAGQVGVAEARLTIVDGVSLFGRFNATAPGGSDANLVDANDIRQKMSECWFAAAVLAAARANPGAIQSMMWENGDGTATVRLYQGAEQMLVTVPMQLTSGFRTIGLSGDTTTNDGKIYEIWPQVLEAAYAQLVGWDALLSTGGPSQVWQAMFGLGWDSIEIQHPDYVPQDLVDWVVQRVNSGKMVALGTWTAVANNPQQTFWQVGDKQLYTKHVYVVTGIENGKVKLLNPWGDGVSGAAATHTLEIPLTDLKTYFLKGFSGSPPE